MGRVDTEADLGQVRHAIDVKSLENYLTKKCPNDFEAPFTIKQFGFGQSNPSYQITDSRNRKYVLRKQPHGKLVSKTAHRVDREFYMMKALYPKGIPVPKVIDLCEDKSVIGVSFYMMEFIANGRIFHDPTLPELSPKDRRECWESAIKTLSQLHSLNPRDLDLPESFLKNLSSHYARQLVTLGKVAKAQAEVVNTKTQQKVGPIPKFDEICQWMDEYMPPEKVSIVHGDYKIDNLVFHGTENRVVAMLDWELCTIGHPLADLGNLLMPYSIPKEVKQAGSLKGLGDSQELEDIEGLPTLDEHFALYEKLSGWNPKKYWTFAVVFSHFRLSVIVHGIKAREAVGQASSEKAAQHAQAVPVFAGLAWQEILGSTKQKL